MDSEAEFRDFLAEYTRLQRSLLTLLARDVDLEGREFFNDLPGGYVEHEGKAWSYRGHGRGVTLERGGTLVNAHVAAFAPDAVDAWRLCVYAASRGVRTLSNEGGTFDAEETNIELLLEVLARNGDLVREEVAPGRTVYRSPAREKPARG